MIRQAIPILILLTICTYTQDQPQNQPTFQPLQFPNYIVLPQVIRQKLPPKTINKLVFESVTQFLKDVNFELSTNLYTHKGQPLSQNQIYNISNYQQQTTECSLFKTDLRLRQYREILLRERTLDRIVIEKNNTHSQVISTIYTRDTTDMIRVVKIKIPKQFQGRDLNTIDWQLTALLPQQATGFKVQTISKAQSRFLQIDGQLYILTNGMLLVKEPVTMMDLYTQLPVSGFSQSSRLIKTGRINDKDSKKRFYTFTQDYINIYEFVSQTQVNKVLSITDLKDETGLQDIFYDSGFFYVVGLDSIYVVDIVSTAEPKIFKGKLNGTCTHVQKFSSTLHVTCTYNKITYIVQFLTFGSELRINRYYAGQDIQGRAISKRLGGLGKMAILTDNSLKILSYALNKHALVQYEKRQPQYSFSIRFGIDLIPIKVASNQFRMTFILFTAQKIALLHILQVPPQLYCQFPNDVTGSSYQFLLQFNTTRCSYVKRQQDLMYGNIQSMCQITIPITINSKQIQIQAKQSNFIMIILGLMITGLLLIIIACAIKYNRSLQIQFIKLQKKLQKVKKGYSNKDKITI